MSRFVDRVAIVTGAGSGIGAATAITLAADGAQVVVADLDATAAAATVEKILAAGGEAIAHEADVSDEQAVSDTVDAAITTFGRLDILHNNAADLGPMHLRDTKITDGEVEVWDRTLAVNLRGVMLGCKYAIPRMIDHGGGVIVNTSSEAALWAGPARVAYAASKSAIHAVTCHVAARYGRDGIRCLAVVPGLIVNENTPASSWFVDTKVRHQAIDRTGTPQDIANVVAFLASDAAGFMTGVAIPVDGGSGISRSTFADELDHELQGLAARSDKVRGVS